MVDNLNPSMVRSGVDSLPPVVKQSKITPSAIPQKGWGVAALILLGLNLILAFGQYAYNFWIQSELQALSEIGAFEERIELFDKRALMWLITAPVAMGTAFVALVCLTMAERKVVSKTLVGLMLTLVILEGLSSGVGYLYQSLFFRELNDKLGEAYGFGYISIAIIRIFFDLAIMSVFCINRNLSIKICMGVALFLSALMGAYIISNLLMLERGPLPTDWSDQIRSLFSFAIPFFDWMSEHDKFRSAVSMIFGRMGPALAFLVLAAMIALGKPTRPENQLQKNG